MRVAVVVELTVEVEQPELVVQVVAVTAIETGPELTA
jgi:hypothetical protein